jgi:helicase
MNLEDIRSKIPVDIYAVLERDGITELRPSQEKAIVAGLLDGKNLLVCTPTASGKTLIAELAMTKNIVNYRRKAVYIVPLKALASEKFKDFRKKYDALFKIALSVGDVDRSDSLRDADIIVCTAEKLDSLIRHHAPWLSAVRTVVIDEIHLLHDVSRGPVLEILITMLRQLLSDVQIIGLSATVGNARELASWLDACLVEDSWRPVKLFKGVYWRGDLNFSE